MRFARLALQTAAATFALMFVAAFLLVALAPPDPVSLIPSERVR